ncbi:hypothetical protein ACFPZ0_00720 [Streptomonospora nanhaiensis]|uniref:hypothetical protein n=1 Tax=Streptomonospora nanhaiensis TaxID=1323731 RepID=UPI001C9956D8|nr:hypothetical protein [Streptomonospora nanhaiensis]MBX9386918.1 hypothetical protein [Streptomonospora nanhaiensis]
MGIQKAGYFVVGGTFLLLGLFLLGVFAFRQEESSSEVVRTTGSAVGALAVAAHLLAFPSVRWPNEKRQPAILRSLASFLAPTLVVIGFVFPMAVFMIFGVNFFQELTFDGILGIFAGASFPIMSGVIIMIGGRQASSDGISAVRPRC